jgi:hypothetical protein
MTPENILQFISVIIEAGACILGVAIAVRKKLVFGWLFALTFGIYVVFDMARIVSGSEGPDMILSGAFLIASLSAVAALWLIYRKE